MVDKLEAVQNQKFEDLATHISSGFETLANIFAVTIPTLAGPQKRKASVEDDAKSNEPVQKSPGLISNLVVFPHAQLRSLLLRLGSKSNCQ